jgi:hypothetical protein
MRKRSSRRLAGCIVIELALAAGAMASDFQAATATVGGARVLVLEDAKGKRALFAQTEFHITQSLADFVAAQVLRDYAVDRPQLLLRWSGIGSRPSHPEDLLTAIQTAMDSLAEADLRYGHRSLSVLGIGGACLASLSPDGALGFEHCPEGVPVTGPIRAAFQMVEPSHSLQKRDGPLPRSYPVQAIAFGKQVTILALSGEAAIPPGINPRGLIFAPFSNEESAAPQDARVRAAVQSVLARVK